MENYESRNTVKATNQVSEFVYSLGNTEGSPKILFLGNSITKHGPAPHIGWHGNWGMGASSEENDYVHICMKEISKKYPDAAFAMVQGAKWERSYRDCDLDEFFSKAKDFNPDVLICCLSENVDNNDFDHEVFIKQFRKLHAYLMGENTKIIVASSFFNNESKNSAIEAYAKEYGASYVYVSDLIQSEENLASEYKHEGIKIHPGDKGMAIMASRVMEAFNELEI